MFRITLNRAALNIFVSRPVIHGTSLPPRSHVRLRPITRQVNSSNTKERLGPLMAAMGATVVLALAMSPVRADIPKELAEEVQKAWVFACFSDPIAAAREAALLDTRLWLAYYFRGDFIDEGPFDQPLVVFKGLHILPEDTRVFYLPAETPAITNYADMKNGRVKSSEMAKFYPYLILTAVAVQLGRRILPKWAREGRFKRVGVLIRWADGMTPMLYENGKFFPVTWESMVGDSEIATV